jgi:hypothetical protein
MKLGHPWHITRDRLDKSGAGWCGRPPVQVSSRFFDDLANGWHHSSLRSYSRQSIFHYRQRAF